MKILLVLSIFLIFSTGVQARDQSGQVDRTVATPCKLEISQVLGVEEVKVAPGLTQSTELREVRRLVGSQACPVTCDDTSDPACQGKKGGAPCGPNGGVCVGAPQCYCNQ